MALGGGTPVREENGERVEVGMVDARDVGVGYDDVRQVAQCLKAVGKADGQQGESKVGGGEERVLGEWRAAMPVEYGVSNSLQRPRPR